MIPLLINSIKKTMQENLPGKTAHIEMMVKPQYKLEKKTSPKPAAVLILLYPENKEWHFFLTKRSKNVKNHKGQISLPGGTAKKNESLRDAAIRETHEEIGIKPNTINIIGALTSFYIPVSGFKISPYVGWIKHKPKLTIQNTEVSKVFSPSITSLMKKETKKEKQTVIFGNEIKIPFFELEGEMVWGATSMIISEFKYILKETICL